MWKHLSELLLRRSERIIGDYDTWMSEGREKRTVQRHVHQKHNNVSIKIELASIEAPRWREDLSRKQPHEKCQNISQPHIPVSRCRFRNEISTWHFWDSRRLSHQRISRRSVLKSKSQGWCGGGNCVDSITASPWRLLTPPACRRSDREARLIVKGRKVKITTRNSPSAHNSTETCASYQSASARDPHRLVREWTCFDKAHCCLTRIYHISAAAAPAAVCCLTEWVGIRSSWHE